MSEEIDNRGVEGLSNKVDNPYDAVEIIKKIEKIMKSKKKPHSYASLPSRHNFQKI